jgi:two-component system LytT family response regulator
MIKTLIIDDEQHCIDSIKNLIDNYGKNLNIVATCSTVEEAIEKTNLLNPDLVFLDIEIHDQTGFDYLEQLGEFDFNLIFTTAFNNYAIKAFKYSAMDYLLKPIDSDDFIGAIKRLKKRISASDTKAQIKMLLNNLKKEDHKKTIRIPNLDGFEIVEISDIIHCQAETSYTHIFTEHQKFMVSKGIKFYEDLLKDANFFRIHNSHLVNINHVKKYTKGKGGYVTMSNNSTIEVSTRKKEEFLKLFK